MKKLNLWEKLVIIISIAFLASDAISAVLSMLNLSS